MLIVRALVEGNRRGDCVLEVYVLSGVEELVEWRDCEVKIV